MRRFIDLHLRPPPDVKEAGLMLQRAAELGYSAVAVASAEPSAEQLRPLGEGLGLDLISRVDLRPMSQRELPGLLTRVRRSFEVVAVECSSKAVARQAAKDHRVDIIDFPASPSARAKVWFDPPEAALALQGGCAYEIDLSDLLGLGPSLAAARLSFVRREVDIAGRAGVPVVASSGVRSHLLVREPLGVAALLDLVGLGEEEALDAVSSVPWGIVEGNRAKLSHRFVAPGVRMVTEGAG